MNKGHYIWNRAERVDEKNMPHVVVEAFNKWQRRKMNHFNLKNDHGKSLVLSTINRQKKQMKENLTSLGYEVN